LQSKAAFDSFPAYATASSCPHAGRQEGSNYFAQSLK